MKHEFKDDKVNIEDIKYFIEPIKMTLPLQSGFARAVDNYYKSSMNWKNAVVNTIVGEKLNDYQIAKYFDVQLIPSKDGWYFGFYAPDVFNGFMKYLGYPNRIDSFCDKDDEDVEKIIKNQMEKNINECLLKEKKAYSECKKNPVKDETMLKKIDRNLELLTTLNYNLNSIFNITDIDLTEKVADTVVLKNALFHLACQSLFKLEETNDSIYSVFAKEYYDSVISSFYNSSYSKLQWPSSTYVNSIYYWYDTYHDEYKKINPALFKNKREYSIEVKNYFGNWELIKSGYITRDMIAKSKEITRKNTEMTLEKYLMYEKQFEEKLNFFESSKYNYLLLGKDGLDGYFGYTYDNDYLIADKLYSNLRLQTILTKNEAGYAFPADRFELSKLCKQDIINEAKTDDRIKRYYHTESSNYLKKYQEVIDSENLSTESFEKVLKKECKRII